MDIAARSLKIKRTTIGRLMEEGLYPYTKRYLGSFDNHFSTIGLVGMNEAGLNANWLRKDLTHEETQDFAVRVLKHMRERLSDYQEQYGDLYNLEATPAESTSYRLAKHDKAQYPNIITAHEAGRPTTPIPATCLWLHGGRVRRPRCTGQTPDPLHQRHGVPHLPGRKAARLAGSGGAGP